MKSSRYNSIVVIAAIIILFIFMVNMISFFYPIYWIIPWFDNLMHFIGGTFLSFFVVIAALKFFIKDLKKEIHYFLIFLAFVLLVGFLWELFEFSIDTFITFKIQDYVDSITDLFFDLLGGFFGLLIIWRFFTPTINDKNKHGRK